MPADGLCKPNIILIHYYYYYYFVMFCQTKKTASTLPSVQGPLPLPSDPPEVTSPSAQWQQHSFGPVHTIAIVSAAAAADVPFNSGPGYYYNPGAHAVCSGGLFSLLFGPITLCKSICITTLCELQFSSGMFELTLNDAH